MGDSSENDSSLEAVSSCEIFISISTLLKPFKANKRDSIRCICEQKCPMHEKEPFKRGVLLCGTAVPICKCCQEQKNATSFAKSDQTDHIIAGSPKKCCTPPKQTTSRRFAEKEYKSEFVDDSNQIPDDEEDYEQDACEPEMVDQPKPEYPKLPPRPAPEHTEPRTLSIGNEHTYVAIVLVVLAIALGSLFFHKYHQKQTPKRSSCEHFRQLHAKYPNADDMLWTTLIVGVDRAINRDPGEPTTFIFLYNSSNLGQSLLADVTRIAIGCFGTDGAIWRTSNDFQSVEIVQDYGNVLDRHREELKSRGVLVVRDLDRVPPTAAQIFFTICDSYEPLVNKAVIFFTIDISGQPTQVVQSDRSATAIAECILKDLWRGELKPNVLDPLVARLTENVFRID